jgi:hypothetical protein
MWRIVRQAAVTVAFLAATSLIASAQNGSTVRAGGHAPDAVSAGGPAAGTSPGDRRCTGSRRTYRGWLSDALPPGAALHLAALPSGNEIPAATGAAGIVEENGRFLAGHFR